MAAASPQPCVPTGNRARRGVAGDAQWAIAVAGLAVGVVAALVGVPRRWVWRWPWLWRTIERAYLTAVVVMGGGWLTAATLAGPLTDPLPAFAVVFTLAGAIPWW